ncbi:MAG: putative metal-binding motif-containing protein [Pseudomonadota bacterium]|nr:putative metal-binding motif-containing protein [Pseudomonadota bacterium]
MILWGLLAGCWIDLSDLDGKTANATCSGGALAVTWFRDGDGDGYGNDAEAIVACDPPLGFATAGGDCDERDPNVNPATPETCNGADDDCDFQVDEGGAAWCNDNDLDGHGDPEDVIYACERPFGYVGGCDDCDDGDPTSYAGAPELADEIDNDCDEQVDE